MVAARRPEADGAQDVAVAPRPGDRGAQLGFGEGRSAWHEHMFASEQDVIGSRTRSWGGRIRTRRFEDQSLACMPATPLPRGFWILRSDPLRDHQLRVRRPPAD